MTTAVVVGSGPNGLAAAAVLARAGVSVTVLEAADVIGGGTRSAELTLPGVLHDVCSAVHPMGAASPLFRELGLERYGLVWRWPEIDLAHPLDGGRAAVMVRSVEETAAGLGADGVSWARLFGPLGRRFDALNEDLVGPVLHLPRHPLLLAGFGLRALAPADLLARRWKGEEARALFAGAAAHALRPLSAPGSAAVGLALLAAGHRHGWPVAQGGSRAVSDALAAFIAEHGGQVRTGVRVGSLAELPEADMVLLDIAPGAAADLGGDRMPPRVRAAYRRYRHGPAAFKVDLAVDGGVPWTHPACTRAGTLHVGGSFEEIAASEAAVARGVMPEKPFVLVAQQYLADPGRSVGDVHPVWAYAHVPSGFTGDATDAVLSQVERFAPGFRERVVAVAVRGPVDLQQENVNYVGGDIANGANSLRQLAFRPRPARDPYATGIPGVYLCSAATPPGGGVHGMCGANAARAALRCLR